ncbi:MAG TPA: zinc-binding dehydrogenase [Stellaceae bacterium]|nr:zinc-binding dehydrogenase [Stellaceae bacterium]
MKAAVLVRQNEALDICELELPRLDIGQVLVKVEHSGICGKQIDEITGRQGADKHLPHLLGHEGGGEVVEIGPGVKKVKPGDRVVMHWVKGSGIDSAPPRFAHKGREISAGWVTTFSNYTIASENRLTPVPRGAKSDVMALLGCAVTTGLGIVFNNARLRPGQSIAVFGVGGVGLNVVQGAALVNAYPIVALDKSDEKLAFATRFGATHTVNVDKVDAAMALAELSRGEGFDAVVDTTGVNRVRETAYDATHPKTGTTILCGVPFAGDRLSIDSFPLHMGRRVIGSHGGDTVPDTDIPRYFELYRLGKLKLDELITNRFTLGEINDAVALVRAGQACGRCVVAMDGHRHQA